MIMYSDFSLYSLLARERAYPDQRIKTEPGSGNRMRCRHPGTAGLTLIELLIAVSISTILAGVVIFMLNTSFDSYIFSQREILLDKTLDNCLDEISTGGFDNFGLKDALEILEVSEDSITFVPPWIDKKGAVKPEHSHPDLAAKTPFILDRPVKRGSFTPIAEVTSPDGDDRQAWSQIPVAFSISGESNIAEAADRVFLEGPLDPGSRIRFIYQPDATFFPECAMKICWEGNNIVRRYNDIESVIPKNNTGSSRISGLEFRYFDNTNTEVIPEPEFIPNITAVKVSLEAGLKPESKKGPVIAKTGFAYINIRNSRVAGKGLIIQKGTRIRIPDSRNIRVFSVADVTGIKKDGTIQFVARPEQGSSWKIKIDLGFDDDTPILKKYTVEYPKGVVVYSETINLTTDIPLNLLNLGGNGLYDYDYDESGDNFVDLKGEVELEVTEMDAGGAVIYIRP